ncbi:UPF0464 protein C15orf44-like, partial [Tropilaelaps mercedesae]
MNPEAALGGGLSTFARLVCYELANVNIGILGFAKEGNVYIESAAHCNCAIKDTSERFTMPTVLLIDASLSMCRPVELADRPEPMQLRHLAVDGLNHLLQYLAIHCKLEFCSIVVYSSLWEVVEPFTRDFDALRDRLTRLQFYDRTAFEAGIEGAKQAVLHEWGATCSCQ